MHDETLRASERVLGAKAAFPELLRPGLRRVSHRRWFCRRWRLLRRAAVVGFGAWWVWPRYIRRRAPEIPHAQLFCTQALLGVMVSSALVI